MDTWKPSGLLRYEYSFSHVGWGKELNFKNCRRGYMHWEDCKIKSGNPIYEIWYIGGFLVQPGTAENHQTGRHQLSSSGLH